MLAFSRVLALIAIGAGSAFALGGVKVQLLDGYGSGPGGEFDAKITLGSINYSFSSQITFAQAALSPHFITFCIERDETFVPGGSYWVSLSDKAQLGGANTNSGDPIDPWTAWVYTNFANKMLGGYSYDGAGRVSDATALQDLFWFLENEFSINGWGYNYDPHSEAAALAKLSGKALAWWYDARTAGWTTIGNVLALNTWDNENLTGARQSQLVLLDNPVPAPAAVALGLIGLAIVGSAKRRFA